MVSFGLFLKLMRSLFWAVKGWGHKGINNGEGRKQEGPNGLWVVESCSFKEAMHFGLAAASAKAGFAGFALAYPDLPRAENRCSQRNFQHRFAMSGGEM